jgi:hypothetical protein
VEVLRDVRHEQTGGAGIHNIERFDDVLPFAFRVHWPNPVIFEVQLRLDQWIARRQRLALARPFQLNAPVLAQYLPNRPRRAGQRHA